MNRPPVPSGHGSLKTQLGAEERAFRATSRAVAFYAIAVSSVAACVAAVYFWHLWVATARTCVNTYILRTTASALIEPGKAESLRDYLAGLDISSFSALILALLFTRLAVTGIKNTIVNLYRDGTSYFDHAYHGILFPITFEQLCIRLGLLGTLLSFLLAAISQMGDASPATSAASTVTLQRQVENISREGASHREVATGDSSVSSRAVTTSELSGQMFLLLCASLVSTFVGTGAAYIVTPSLNWVHDRAVGRHQLREVDPAFACEEFFRQIDRTSLRLAQFDVTTSKIATAAEQMSRFEEGVTRAAEKLDALLRGIETAVVLFETSNRNGKQLSEDLCRVEELSRRWHSILRKLPNELNGTLDGVNTAGSRLLEASLAAKLAFAQLRATAGTARKSLEETEHRTNVNWHMLRELRDSLSELAGSERTQTEQVIRLADSSVRLGDTLGGLTRELECLLRHVAGHDGADGDIVRSLGSIENRLTQIRKESSGTALTAHPSASRAWWRRLLG